MLARLSIHIDIVAESLKPSENLIKIDGSVQASGAARKIALAEGKSTVIRVDNYEVATAPAPSSTYTITVHRRAAVAGLTELENVKLTAYDSTGSLIGELETTSPISPREMNYYVKTPANAAKIEISAEAAGGASVSGTGEFLLGGGFASGKAKAAIITVRNNAEGVESMQGYSITFMPESSVNPVVKIRESEDIDGFTFDPDAYVQKIGRAHV